MAQDLPISRHTSPYLATSPHISPHLHQEEFRIPWRKIFPRLGADDFERAWKGIDQNGDGELSLRELADHYGFQLSPSGMRKGDEEMTDEQILEALQMHQAMHSSVRGLGLGYPNA
jgi:hypothetical protein